MIFKYVLGTKTYSIKMQMIVLTRETACLGSTAENFNLF